MTQPPPHLFVDISSHGYGHLAQTAPVLNRLANLLPDLRLTVRSGLPEAKLRQRIALPFALIPQASDFGYVMLDALRIDRPATAAAYRAASANFSRQVEDDAQTLKKLRADAVLTDISYHPLAGAARAGIPAVALCSLNWADLFQHYFGSEAWAAAIHAQMLAAYRGALFLRTTPGMTMPALDNIETIGPIAAIGQERRAELCRKLGVNEGNSRRADNTAPRGRIVLVALGGIPTRLPVEHWPALPNTHWLVPAAWNVRRADMIAFEPLGWNFADLLRSSDAVVTKPGYGTFTEAACNGTAVLYQCREDWPEQDCLIEWLHANARCREISALDLRYGNLANALDTVLQTASPPAPTPDGITQAAAHITRLLKS